ncbi:uncharacterized protein Z518_09356 [Rhinocladiella mackenziei CBS 650.93]|uniref:DNA mismatch repair protein S5 domain-containing protein n=1 Tax=Rhinocladiella mackenziei CBS 650.93 TaxID=1442369 RepID=A0A0D2IYF9_9EURO|nr:uncharacterized protein Z518_09356 [Rhinocladiella mackenziei CBS 650.93]KIX01630.1 hypothetical protein Z518_09356 [Rhinocladiella mackenziei CBS 650.93]
MSIQALPETTTRALGSSLVLNDAKSVVKELVDNALDARATSIGVEISANTLDVIQVKDNGTGVGIEDRQLLCKRGCTSKIRTLDDLNRLGGSSLGFRGEALASVAELSRTVTVTTRVDGEVVGTSVKYTASGMLSSSSASHPVGTTIRVQDFLAKIPVRKQIALKNIAKTLQSIKALLFSFAFARTEVRFSLNVLKGKNDKMNWTYAAASNDSLTDIASKIVGKEITAECTAYDTSSTGCDVGEEDWKIKALLVSPGADLAKVRNAAQHISVDGRPVSGDRGTMKEIVKIYKRCLEHTLSSAVSSSLSRPFLFMQIQCPPQSYDINVEPAKDEALFFRPHVLLSLVENLFRRAYGDIHNAQIDDVNRTRSSETSEATSKLHRTMYVADLEDLGEPESSIREEARDSAEPGDISVPAKNMSNPFTIAAMTTIVTPKEMRVCGQNTLQQNETRTDSNWLSVERRLAGSNSHRTSLGPETHLPSSSLALESPIPYQNPGPLMKRRANITRQAEDEEQESLTSDDGEQSAPSKRTSLQAWLTPNSSVRPRPVQGVRISVNDVGGSPEARHEHSTRPPQPANGTRWSPPGSVMGLKWGPGQKPFKFPLKRDSHHHSHPSTTSNSTSPGSLLIPDELVLERGGAFDSEQVNEDDAPSTRNQRTLSLGIPRLDTGIASPAFPSSSATSNTSTELDDIMDFEHRKKIAMAYQRRLATKLSPRKSLRGVIGRRSSQPDNDESAEGDGQADKPGREDSEARFRSWKDPETEFELRQTQTRSNPHQNRYLAAMRDLSQSHSHSHSRPSSSQERLLVTDDLDANPTPHLAQDDPRAYFMRQQRRSGHGLGHSKLHRTKSSRLPLETISSDAVTVNLALTADAFKHFDTVKKCFATLTSVDRYVASTGGEAELTADLLDANVDGDWGSELRHLVRKNYRYQANDGRTLVPHLQIAVSKMVDESISTWARIRA